jgi:hypothetical protein
MLGFKTYVIYETINAKNISFPIYFGQLFDCGKN